MKGDREDSFCRDTFDLVHGFVIASMQGELSEEEVADFEQLLRDSREARRLYAAYLEDTIQVVGLLSNSSEPSAAPAAAALAEAAPAAAGLAGAGLAGAGLAAAGLAGAAAAEPAANGPLRAAPLALPAAAPARSPVLGFLGAAVDYVNHSRMLLFTLVALTLTGWFAFQLASVLLSHRLGQEADLADRGARHAGAASQMPARKGRLADGSNASHPNAMAWLSALIGSRWQVLDAAGAAVGNSEGGVFWANGTEFAASQQVRLVTGLAEITFHSGAKLILTSPAQFAVASPLAARLEVGKLTAKVPHGVRGFTISTPAGSVVDLGTEFGVNVSADHKMDVQVFVGEVRVNSSPDGGGNAAAAQVHVLAGKTVHLEPGKPPRLVASKQNRFQRSLTIDRDSNDKRTAAYLDFLRGLKPVVWLRMERPGTRARFTTK